MNSAYINTISANAATYLNGKLEAALNVNSALTANSSTYLGSKLEAGLNVNSALTANAATYLNGKLEAALNVNSALTANNSTNLGGVSSANYVQNTDSRTLSGNLVFSGANTTFSNKVTINGALAANDVTISGNLIVSGTTTSVNTNTLEVKDVNITVAKGAANSLLADAGGLTVEGAGATWQYTDATASWNSNLPIRVGNSSVNASINSTAFTGTANNSTFAFGKTEIALNVNNSLTSNNASFLGGIAAANFVQNTDSRTLSGNLVFSGANVTSSGNFRLSGGLIANSALGTAGHVLHTNGTSVYWATDDQGVTSVTAGNGLAGNITSTGTISVVGNTGIVANATGVYVNASYISTISSNNATFINGNSVITVMESLRANRNISGGGTITVDGSGNVLWNSRFIIISNGRGTTFGTSGYFDIACPTSGTITGVGGAANKTATAAGIPLGAWEALYYIMPIGSAATSLAANFRVASYTADVDIPSDWVLLCIQNGDEGKYYFNNGVVLKAGQSFVSSTWSSALVPAANNSTNLGGVAAANYVQNTDSRTLSGNLVFSAANVAFIGNIRFSGGVISNNSLGTSKQLLASNGTASYWSTPDMTFFPDAAFKKSVRAATTADLSAASATTTTLTGGLVVLPAQDGITLVVGDRLLVKNQTAPAQNGIYEVTNVGVAGVTAWVLTRPSDADTISKISSALVAVDSGTTQGGKLYDNDAKTTDTLGTTAMVWSQNVDEGGGTFTGNVLFGTSAGLYPTSNTVGTALGSTTQRWSLLANTIGLTGTLTLGGGLSANGTLGTSKQVLYTNGTTPYWGTALIVYNAAGTQVFP